MQQTESYEALNNSTYYFISCPNWGAELGLQLKFIQQAAGIASFSSAIKQKKMPRRDFGTPFTGPPWGDQPWAQPIIGAGYNFAFAFHAGGC